MGDPNLLRTPGDFLLRGLAEDAPYRIAVARTSILVHEGIRRHELPPAAAVALARALTSVALMAVTSKDWGRLSVQWIGRGSFGTVNADISAPGVLRGYVSGPDPVASSVPEGFGAGGLVSVIRQELDHRFSQGQVALGHREVDEDTEAFLRQSEQVPSVLRVLVDVDAAGEVTDVVGLLLQMLPGGDPRALKAEIVAPALLARAVPAGLPLAELIALAAPGLPRVEWMQAVPLRWSCGCSLDRVERGVALLGLAELDVMVEEAEVTEVRCEFCAEVYRVDVPALQRIRAELARS